MRHKHKAEREDIYGYTAPVPRAKYNQRAHGGVCVVETCACGATRRTNSTGPTKARQERGPWVAAEELADERTCR